MKDPTPKLNNSIWPTLWPVDVLLTYKCSQSERERGGVGEVGCQIGKMAKGKKGREKIETMIIYRTNLDLSIIHISH